MQAVPAELSGCAGRDFCGLATTFVMFDEWREKVNRHRQKRGRVVLARNLLQGLQEPELESDRLLRNHRRRLHELFRRLKFSLCIYDFRAPLSFSLGLTGHSPLHAVW